MTATNDQPTPAEEVERVRWRLERPDLDPPARQRRSNGPCRRLRQRQGRLRDRSRLPLLRRLHPHQPARNRALDRQPWRYGQRSRCA